MTFKDYINQKSNIAVSEKATEINRIAEACMVDLSTVYRWINGKCIPDPLKKQKIAEMTNIPMEQLFSKNDILLQ